LSRTIALIKNEGYEVVNVDASLCLQSPKIKSYVPQMQSVIAGILSVTDKDVSIKATTTEQLGFVGREEGVVAQAVVMVKRCKV
jgi:2-C-methyl-D-erythritol 2,4-cyclodiphosphate synthase